MNAHLKTMQIHAIGLAVLVVYLIGGYFAGLRPVITADQRLQQIAVEGEWLQRMLPQLEQEIAQLSQLVQDKRSELVAKYSVVTAKNSPLIGVATELLQQHQIALVNLRETSSANGDVSLDMQITSSYEGLLHFLEDLGRLDRPVHIGSLSLAPQDDQASGFKVSITLKFPAGASSLLT